MGAKMEAGTAGYTISCRKKQWEKQKKMREKLHGRKMEAGTAGYTISCRKKQWEKQKKMREKPHGSKNGGRYCRLYHIMLKKAMGEAEKRCGRE